jgi:hypothetical protein
MTHQSRFTELTGEQTRTERFLDGTCLLWATLALARLDHKLPSDAQALDLIINHNERWALRLRNALEAVARRFADPNEADVWDTLYPSHASELVSELLRTATNYYQELDTEFIFLHAIFKAFHIKICAARVQHAGETFGALGMACAIADQISKLINSRILEIFITINTMRENLTDDRFEAELAIYSQEEVDALSGMVELYVREQTEVLSRGPGFQAIDTNLFVEVVQEPLRTHIRAAFDVLLRALGVFTGNAVSPKSARARQHLRIFYHKIAQFFSYALPLLSDFWTATHNADEDIYEEYTLDNLQNVLPGPEDVEIDQVSVAVSTYPATTCIVCFVRTPQCADWPAHMSIVRSVFEDTAHYIPCLSIPVWMMSREILSIFHRASRHAVLT